MTVAVAITFSAVIILIADIERPGDDEDGMPLAREPPVGNPQKSQGTTFLLALFLGIFGADR